jgi:tetratricopeptide (TPR) repeat protein
VNILTIRRNAIPPSRISLSNRLKGAGMTSAREVVIRGVVQLVAALAIVAGLIGWIAGRRYGHELVTLGLLVYLATFFTRRTSFKRSWGTLELMRATGDEALEHVESAVRSFRKLAAKRPGEARHLAGALDRQWHLLNELGKHEEALPVAREAVENWRAVVVDEPGHRAQLSKALNHVSVSLGRLGLDEESIPVDEEAIVVQRGVVAAQENVLARHLANLAIALRNCARWEEALPPAQEAAGLYRRLVPSEPDLLDTAASTAEGLVIILGNLDRAADAVVAAREHVGYQRARAAGDQDRAPELAEAVRILGGLLIMTDRRDEGQARWRESLEIRRRLAERTAEHGPAYAEACSTIGHGFEALGEAAEALAVFETGLSVRRELAATDPKHYDDLLTELAQAAFSTRVYTGNTEPASAGFAAEAIAVARKHTGSTSRDALTEAADLLSRADFTAEADELERLSVRTVSG